MSICYKLYKMKQLWHSLLYQKRGASDLLMHLNDLENRTDNNFKITRCFLLQSISPGGVLTEIMPNMEARREANHPLLNSEDVSNAVLYVLGTPPHVQVKSPLRITRY